MSKRVLITGPDGFIGSHCVEHLLATTDWHIVGLASWRQGGMGARLSDSRHVQANRNRLTVLTHDLRGPIDSVLTRQIGHCDAVIHFAADSHVDRSIETPRPFIENNVAVTLTMLEWARVARPGVFIQISTDEVYGPAYGEHRHREWEPAIPSNPYSGSKAAQEAIAISYWRTYGVPVVITNTMNNVGERQHPEKFLPMIIRRVMRDEVVTIHAVDGKPGSRFYLHARNHADACRWIIDRGEPSSFPGLGRPGPDADRPDRWHIVGDVELDNLALARLVARMVGKPLRYELVDAHSARPGHDPRYALDGAKIADAGWTPPVPFIESLERTVRWYMAHPEWLHVAPVE